MAIAGKVAITLATENGGAWSADVTYDRLVAVKHNNNLYISRKVVTNVEPPNDEFWFLALEGYSGEDVQALIDRMNAIISGTQQVGNAKTLDGHEAGYFFKRTFEASLSDADIKAVADNLEICPLNSFTRLRIYHPTNAPFENGDFYIEVNKLNVNEYARVTAKCVSTNRTYEMSKANGVWGEWEKIYTSGDSQIDLLENGNTALSRTRVITAVGGTSFLVNVNPDLTKMRQLAIHPISSKANPLDALEYQYTDDGVTWSVHTVLHTGNKPTGTYTGNGSAEQRTIKTGGLFSSNGGACLIYNDNGVGIVTHRGATSISYSGVKNLSAEEAKYDNGDIVFKNTDTVLNNSGSTTTYIVL